MQSTVRLRASVAGVALLAAASAHAQSDAAPPAAGFDGIADIVVTANRRAENLQDVPISIAAVSEATLQTFGIKSAVELPQMVPGLSMTRNATSTNLYLRGVGTISAGYTTEPPIAMYIDGFYLPSTGAAAFSFNNIERIEVLRGPQGTLYGRNSTGGLVNIITRDPGDELKIDAGFSYANYQTVKADFYGSTPLGDGLSANIAVTHQNQDKGWGRNTYLGSETMTQESTGVQAKLKWDLGDTRITLRGLLTHLNTDQGNVYAIFPGSIGLDGTTYAGKFKSRARSDGRISSTTRNVGLKIEHDFGGVTLLSQTGYLHANSMAHTNVGGIPGNAVNGQTASDLSLSGYSKTFIQELQLQSNTGPDAALQWITGLFYYHDNTHQQSDVYPTCDGQVCAAVPFPTSTLGYPNTRSYAVYGEGTYRIASNTRITLGLRYTSDDKSLSGTVLPLAGYPNSVATLPPSVVLQPGDPYPGNPDGINTSVNFSRLTWKAVIAQNFGDNVNVYASYNRGFKSGTYTPTSFNNEPARPEILDAYELGIKSEFLDRKVRLNVAAFHYDYKDLQLRTTAPPAPIGTTITYNAANSRIRGVDVELLVQPVRTLSLNAGVEFLDAKYKSFPAGNCTAPRVPNGTSILGGNATVDCDLSGMTMINAPRWSYNLGISYTLPSTIGDFTLAANDSYKSKSYFDPDNRLSQGGYHLANASLTWTAPSGRFDVQLFGRNLFDKYYFAQVSESRSDVYTPGAPRTYGVRVGFHY